MARRKIEQWPNTYFGPNGAQMICNSESEVPKGWTDVQADAVAADKAGKKQSAGEPKPATATKPATAATAATAAKAAKDETAKTPLAEARAKYREKFGKNPSPRWDVDAINAKIAEPLDL